MGRFGKPMTPIILLIIIVLLLVAAFYNGLVIRNYSVKTDKFTTDKRIRAVLIADLHSCIYGEKQKTLIAKIKKQNPDVILLAGDIVDDETPIDGAKMFLEGIIDLAPVFYVTGNHEYWSGDIDNIKRIIRDYGVTVLENEYKEIMFEDVPVIIAGVDDREWIKYERGRDKKTEEDSFMELADESRFKILLVHRPEKFESYKKYHFDLMVSGHSHGGQVRIPYLMNGLLAPDQGWFPQYAGGLYQHDDMTQIVSRGVSFNPRLPRIFNPPEIVVIDISRQ